MNSSSNLQRERGIPFDYSLKESILIYQRRFKVFGAIAAVNLAILTAHVLHWTMWVPIVLASLGIYLLIRAFHMAKSHSERNKSQFISIDPARRKTKVSKVKKHFKRRGGQRKWLGYFVIFVAAFLVAIWASHSLVQMKLANPLPNESIIESVFEAVEPD